MAMERQRYTEFSARIHQTLMDRRQPLSGTIEITRRCPLTCAHCYNNLPMDDHEARRGELTLAEHHRIVEEIAEAGCLWLLYSGGEIFARRDFLDIYTHAKKQGLLITLFTNGTLISPRIADHLAEWPPFSIEITLYGRTRETYERLTGIPGSFDHCMRGIELLMERGLPLKLKSVAVSINKHEIRDMQRFAEEQLGLEFTFDAMMNPRIDCSQSPLAVRLSPEEVVAFDAQDPRRIEEWKKFVEYFHGPVQKPQHSDEVYHCGGGVSSFAIDPEGQMSICVLSHFDKYDLRTGSFREGWEGFLHKVRLRKMSRLTKCVDCQIKALCGMCPANGELENGDPEKPVDFLCHVAHLRARILKVEVPAHGDCEYCEGGSRYPDLVASAVHLKNIDLTSKQASLGESRSLPVMTDRAGCGSGTCSSCDSAFIPG
jgi:radical SAM protein with 4Fe4S-binding SPASM domain